MKSNTEIKDDSQATKPAISGHVEPVVSWNVMTDKNPTKSGDYLIYGKKCKRMDMAYWDNHIGIFGSNRLWSITHWCEIPKAPHSN